MWNCVRSVQHRIRNNTQVLHFVTKKLSSLPKLNSFVAHKTSSINSNTPCFMYVRAFHRSVLKSQDSISALQIKKRPVRKKQQLEEVEATQPGTYSVSAFSTADEYNLEALKEALKKENLYETRKIENLPDVLFAVGKSQTFEEPSEIFFFREGSVVLWNVADPESGNLINFLKCYEQDSYPEKFIQGEVEVMKYKHQLDGKSIIVQTTGEICIAPKDNILEKYAFSNTLASSVKLGIWEATLDRFIESIEYVSEDLKRGAKIKMSIEEVIAKHGELYGLRHLINLSSDLLDTPDFYWEHEELEKLYAQGYAYFSIGRRTKVINEKINHCIELIDLLSRHLSDRHHIRLEWMVIGLIMAEVGFEIVHYVERYLS